MKRFFSQIYLSSTDFSFYRKIVRQKLFATFQYFFVLLFLVSLIATVFNYFLFKEGIRGFSAWADKNLPEITVKEGTVSSPVAQPYRRADGNFIFILDTTGAETRVDPQYGNGVLVMKDRALVKREGVETQEIDLKWVKDLTLNAATVRQWKERALPLLFPILFAVLFLGMVISKTLQALLFALVVWVFSNAKQTGLQLRDLFNLSVYAATPAILVSLLVQSVGVAVPYFPFIYFFMYGAFFIGAFMQCRLKTDKEKDSFDNL